MGNRLLKKYHEYIRKAIKLLVHMCCTGNWDVYEPSTLDAITEYVKNLKLEKPADVCKDNEILASIVFEDVKRIYASKIAKMVVEHIKYNDYIDIIFNQE